MAGCCLRGIVRLNQPKLQACHTTASDQTHPANLSTAIYVGMPNKKTGPKVFAHATFNVPALLDLGKRIRQRICDCDLWQTPASGSLNWAITISFEDGAEWIFRSPRTYWAVDMDTAGSLIASEVATLKYIRRNSSIPVPEVFAFRYG